MYIFIAEQSGVFATVFDWKKLEGSLKCVNLQNFPVHAAH